MGWRFRKSLNLGGGARLNLSRRGVGASFGIPGSGLRYVVSPGRGDAGGGCLGCASGCVLSVLVLLLLLLAPAAFMANRDRSHSGPPTSRPFSPVEPPRSPPGPPAATADPPVSPAPSPVASEPPPREEPPKAKTVEERARRERQRTIELRRERAAREAERRRARAAQTPGPSRRGR